MRFFARFFLMVCFCCASFSVRAENATADSVLFSASGIKVDATAENAALAREQALQEGAKKALMIVMARLTPPDVLERLPELIPDNMVNLVQGTSVSNEKTSAVRYLATLDISLKADAVRAILKDNGLPFVREAGKTLLVLPLYKKSPSATPILFDDDNAWLRAWINRSQTSYMVPLAVPLGELSDVQTLSAEQVVKGDLKTAQKLAFRYAAEGILIVEMTRKGSVFSVSARAMDGVTASEIPNFSLKVPLTKNTAQTYAMAVRKVVDHIETVWKREQMVQFNEPSSLIAMVPVTDLKEWEVVAQRLKRVPSVSSFSLQAARTGLLQVTIFYAESIERLINEAKKRMLVMTALPGGVYKLQSQEKMMYFPVENAEDETTITPQTEREIPSVAETQPVPESERVIWQTEDAVVPAPQKEPVIKWSTDP